MISFIVDVTIHMPVIRQETFPFYSLDIFLSYHFNDVIDEFIHWGALVVPDLGADPQSRDRLPELFSAFRKPHGDRPLPAEAAWA